MKTRLTLELSESVRALLIELRERTGANDQAEVLSGALALYDLATTAKENGDELFLRGQDGQDRQITFV